MYMYVLYTYMHMKNESLYSGNMEDRETDVNMSTQKEIHTFILRSVHFLKHANNTWCLSSAFQNGFISHHINTLLRKGTIFPYVSLQREIVS